MVEITTLQAKERVKKQLLQIEGVTGVGVGSGSGDFINIYVKELTEEIKAKLPVEIDGLPVRIIETGIIKALQRTERIRPVPMGVSVGQAQITAGTAGFVATDNLSGRRVLISNAHVLTYDPTQPTMDDPSVLQPGPADGGILNDKIGETVRWVPIVLAGSGSNLVDGAVCMPMNDGDISDDILEIGIMMGVATAEADMQVQKSGRSSGLNTATVIDTNASITVEYDGVYATFDDIFLTTQCGIPGDSGSAVLTMDRKLCGLLFAGSDKITCHCKIGNVLNALNVSVSGYVLPPEPTVTQAASWLLLPIALGGIYMLWKGGI